MYCAKCGAENDSNNKFCIKCGTKLLISAVQTEKYTRLKNIFKKRIFDIAIFKNIKISKTAIIIFGILTVLSLIVVFFLGINTQIQDAVTVSIYSIPSGADVYIESELVGHTPMDISLPEGSYSFKLYYIKYKILTSNFNVTTKKGYDTTIVIDAILEPADT